MNNTLDQVTRRKVWYRIKKGHNKQLQQLKTSNGLPNKMIP